MDILITVEIDDSKTTMKLTSHETLFNSCSIVTTAETMLRNIYTTISRAYGGEKPKDTLSQFYETIYSKPVQEKDSNKAPFPYTIVDKPSPVAPGTIIVEEESDDEG
jgi:hypothetical protein